MARVLGVSLSLLASALSFVALAAPRVAMDNGGRVTSVAGLYPDPTCHPMQIGGRVVRRQFQDNELRMKGVVLEEENGSRAFVNIDVQWDDLDMASLTGVTRGLQTLLKEGRTAKLSVRACGAAERVMFLDSVK